MFKLILSTLTLAMFLLVFGLVGSSDYEAEVAQEELYTSMVCEGLWPDYENRNPNCEVTK
jgi:hypothetical protein